MFTNPLKSEGIEPIYHCDKCGDGIYEGAEYIVLSGNRKICKHCIDRMNVSAVLKTVGIEFEKAVKERGN